MNRPRITVKPHVKRPRIPVQPIRRPVAYADPYAIAASQWREFFPGGQAHHISDTVWNDPSVSPDSARYQ